MAKGRNGQRSNKSNVEIVEVRPIQRSNSACFKLFWSLPSSKFDYYFLPYNKLILLGMIRNLPKVKEENFQEQEQEENMNIEENTNIR